MDNKAPVASRSSRQKSSVMNHYRNEIQDAERGIKSKAWQYDPFAFSMPGFRVGIGGVNMNDIYKELEQLSEAMEDEMNARRAVRQVYEEELQKLRELRADQKKRRQGGSNAISDMPLASTGEQLGEEKVQTNVPAPIASTGMWKLPQLSLEETTEAYEYSLQLDGMRPEDIRLSLEDNILTIGGRKYVEVEGGHYTSEFKRSLTLPQDVKLDTLESAEAVDGQLLLRVEKIKQKLPSSREILIERTHSSMERQVSEVVAPADGADAVLAAVSEDKEGKMQEEDFQADLETTGGDDNDLTTGSDDKDLTTDE